MVLDNGTTLPCDLSWVPKNRAADVDMAAGLTEGGWVPLILSHFQTKFSGVYAVAIWPHTGVPKAGVYAEGAARTVAANIISRMRNEAETARNPVQARAISSSVRTGSAGSMWISCWSKALRHLPWRVRSPARR